MLANGYLWAEITARVRERKMMDFMMKESGLKN